MQYNASLIMLKNMNTNSPQNDLLKNACIACHINTIHYSAHGGISGTGG